ncbi:PhzF family phenazine biosynthesis protein [Niveibacterium sp. 24ML]|uniref:PhzF family phenazine biosynthesis protein n=1 Tax=Niveibacterium sp. 24ML TaxID=2985512 RepID=UPI002270825E|nr:PhzF family phenazine biosynthesis protein [Niveibacterium sp. 24ML]MCX9155399.1 PhzF family phenazine biosynthesis protein [Niveibacterium sp. 24ML]
MANMRYWLADVFTHQPFTGNPLAVFPDAAGLAPALMPRIAAELNLSETVFVLPPADPAHTARVRIFTPATELPFAGHPTIGTALMLARFSPTPLADGEHLIVLEEGVGPVPVTVTVEGGQPVCAEFATAQAPSYAPAPDVDSVAAMLGLVDDVLPHLSVASCGVPYLCVPLHSREALARATPNTAAMKTGLAGLAHAIYAYTVDRDDPALLHARMFAPGLGVLEDPATGSAAAALGALLAQFDLHRDVALSWEISQGEDMGRPSRIRVSAEVRDKQVVSVRVGGQAVFMGEGLLAV